MRFYDIQSGEIRVGNTGIQNITRDSLRANFGMVLQETWLKAGTIAENIAYGKEDATREEIIAAAKAAHAHGFIRRMEQGYDTLIQEEGGNLSQGQKQLLCIARVMLRIPDMLILDEATSSIDTRTEMKIQEAFQSMMRGRTSFIVAHRLSTIREADVILVMKDGNIIEQGSHEELLEKGGFYKNLYGKPVCVLRKKPGEIMHFPGRSYIHARVLICKTVFCEPVLIGRCEDRFVRKRSRTAFFQSKKRLIQLLVGKSAEYDHCIGELFSVINFFRRCHVRQPCKYTERLAVIFECNVAETHTKRKQCTFHFLFYFFV